MTTFLDTNVIAYMYDDAAPTKQARARAVYVEHAADAVVSTQVLIELHAVLTRKFGHTRENAHRVLDAINLDIVSTDAGLVLAAASTAIEHQLSIFDALIVEAAARAGCEELWTEDLRHGATLRGVRIVDPFRPDQP